MLAVAGLLAGASPALACRVSREPIPPAVPPYAERLVFTATVDARWGSAERRPGADLKVVRRILGEVQDRVDATWSGRVWPPEPVAPAAVGDGQATELEQVIVHSCARDSWYGARLREAPMGAEVVVLARRTPSGVDVQNLALLNSVEGREILALARP
jgi:hypothetical protein